MRAYVRGGAGKDPFHGHELRLTIGLIVKNAEKTLDRCLSSLSRLREEVPSELIVTDTGSTDRTVEIARKYTDNVLFFDWCGDFSAARNTGLFAAKGEWFLFLDADEWFEDTAELARFFNSGECDEYWTGSYVVRNYNDWKGKKYNDFHACRMYRMYPGIQFQHRIHEDIQRRLPTKMLGVFVHHYGYLFRSKAEREEKIRRNKDLLLSELQEDPEDLKALSQMAEQCMFIGEAEQAVRYAEKGLKLSQSLPFRERRFGFVMDLIGAYFSAERYARVMEETDSFFASETVRNVFHLEISRYAQIAALRLQQYRRSVEYGESYLQLYDDYTAGKMDTTLLMFALFRNNTAEAREGCLMNLAQAYSFLEDYGEAVRTFRRLDFSAESLAENGSLPLCFDLVRKTDDFSLLADYSKAYLSAAAADGEDRFADFAEAYQQGHPDEERKIRRALAEMDLGPYALLCRLREAEDEGDHVQAREFLGRFAQTAEKLPAYAGDALYYAMTEEKNVMPLLLKADADDFPAMALRAGLAHSELPETVEKYAELYSFQNAVGLRWMACALERAVLCAAESDEPERCLKLCDVYIRNFMKLIRATYLPEMLAKPSLPSLPRPVRFACQANSAFAARNRGDGMAYISGLRAALREYPAMEKPVQLLLDRFEEEQKKQEAKAKEFAELAKQVKSNIESLIARGDLTHAGQITAQLAALMPNDEDVHRFQKLTHTEPTMREIASHLPQ